MEEEKRKKAKRVLTSDDQGTGQAFRAFLERNTLSLKDLAEALKEKAGVSFSPAYLSLIKRGDERMSDRLLNALIKAYGGKAIDYLGADAVRVHPQITKEEALKIISENPLQSKN